MSKDLYNDGDLSVTQFWGGEKAGQCVQITQPSTQPGTVRYFDYVQLDRDQAEAVVNVLVDWLYDHTKEDK
jgi:hypothetical protein